MRVIQRLLNGIAKSSARPGQDGTAMFRMDPEFLVVVSLWSCHSPYAGSVFFRTLVLIRHVTVAHDVSGLQKLEIARQDGFLQNVV